MPIHPLPPPLRGAEPGSFAEDTIVNRLPRILRQTMAATQWPPAAADRLAALLAEMPQAPLRPLNDGAADNEEWALHLAPFLGQSWLEAPWLVVEIYFYRRILEAVGYYRPGPGQGRDPFAHQKSPDAAVEALAQPAAVAADQRADGDLAGGVRRLLAHALWGNQADRSMFPDGAGQPASHAAPDRADHTLVDHSETVLQRYLTEARPLPRVDLLLDNAGDELAYDLLLADFLLSGGLARTVHLHAKRYPFFVSDAMPRDVWAMAAAFADAGGELGRGGRRLLAWLEQGQLRLRAHAFWTLPTSYWQMPADLRDDLARSSLLISKGDANYRRWLGDRAWTFHAPADQVIDYAPAPLLSLRTCKAPVAVGLDPEQVTRLNHNDSGWLTSGRYGMIQLVGPGGRLGLATPLRG